MKKIFSIFAIALLISSCACNKDNDSVSEIIDTNNQEQQDAETGDAFPVATGRNHVIYELNTGSFTTEGTFNAAGEKLQDLKDLGIDIVWLMPIYPRGGGINSPYAATDFKATNPQYGSIADLKAFVSKAHTLGMEVWLDWVPNHTATDAKWVTSNPEYYKTKNGSMVHPNNYGDVYQLDYSNPDLAAAMTDCLKFWVDEADVDGFRCDYVSSPEIPATYWASAIPEVKNHKAGKTITFLAEGDLTNSNNRGLVTTGFEYDYAWDFQESGLYKTVGKGISGSSLQKVCESMLSATETIKPITRMIYLTNHDQNYNDGGHLISDIYGENVYPLTALIFTFKGMPLVYNGQEAGGKQILDYFNDTKIKWSDKDEKNEKAICVRALNDQSNKNLVFAHYEPTTRSILISSKGEAGSAEYCVYVSQNEKSGKVCSFEYYQTFSVTVDNPREAADAYNSGGGGYSAAGGGTNSFGGGTMGSR